MFKCNRPHLPFADEDEQFKEEKAVIIKEISMLGGQGPSGESSLPTTDSQPMATAEEPASEMQ